LQRPEKTSAEPRFWALWAAAGAVELPWLALLVTGASWAGPSLLLAARFACAALVFFACPQRREAGVLVRPWARTLALAALVLPGWGWALAGLVRPAHERPLPAGSAELAEELQPEDDEAWTASPASGGEDRRMLEAADIAPATDILLGRDPTLKRGAIETLARIRTPQAVSWLLKCRSDTDPEVRFYATAALTSLKRDYEQKRRAAEAELFRKPGSASLELVAKRLALEYAQSGLLDPRSREALLAEARRGLDALAQRRPEALALLFEVELELRPEAALAVLDRLAARDGRQALPWIREKARLLFRLGRYEEVRRLVSLHAAEMLATPSGPLDAREAAEWKSASLWWTNA
jgi:hypothetical protein